MWSRVAWNRCRGFLTVHPLGTILLSALGLRLIAAVFARGYMASDDHFQVVEIAAEWLRGHRVFLAGGEQFYRSLLFPGFHWLIMSACHWLGLVHPDAVMLCVRLALALYSLWPIVVIWRYGEALGGRAVARNAAWLLAAHPLMPYVSVRSLVEISCLPFLLYALYRLDQTERSQRARGAWISGLAFGAALVLRTQVASVGLGVAAYLLVKRRPQWLGLWILGAAAPLAAQGVWDWTLHGRFLGSAWAYLAHNSSHLRGYVVGPWYRYLLLLPGVFLPPFGILFFLSMFQGVRRQGVLFWATVVFVIVHSAVPQKQERFLLPVFPELVLMGVWGLAQWRADSRLRPWIRPGWIFFWTLSAPLLLVSLFHYGQKARIEPLIYLFERGGSSGLVADFTEEGVLLPLYYLDGGLKERGLPPIYEVRGAAEMDSLKRRLLDSTKGLPRPDHVLSLSSGNGGSPFAVVSSHLAPVSDGIHVQPDAVERILRRLNPRYNRGKEAWLGRLRWPL